MANSYLKKEQTLPENETKYFVHANGMWSLDTAKILNDTVQPRSDAHAKNVTQSTTHHRNQSQQKIVSKGTVIKVSSTPSDYFCLCKLVRKGSWEVYFSYFSSSCLKLLGSCGNWEKGCIGCFIRPAFPLSHLFGERIGFVVLYPLDNGWSCPLFKQMETWGPFLESPGNFSGPELYFKIKIYRMVVGSF